VRERSLAQQEAVRAALARYGSPNRVGLEPRLGARKARLLEEIERQL
jgi:hypothetical protein